ncbi:MAG TPA: hypothetical protein VG167_11815 [Verrucomicrobiae bacterium]|nr:hypothetical protein [Verrucomicrobiae bacterium]
MHVTLVPPITRFLQSLPYLFLPVLLLVLTGCSTEKPESKRYASVVVQGNTPGQIAAAATQVLHENGYSPVQVEPPNLVYEKRGNRWAQIKYGSAIDDTPIFVRVKVAIVPAGEAQFRLDAHAYYVWDKGGPTEQEITSNLPRSGPIQKMLEEIVRRLGGKGGRNRLS